MINTYKLEFWADSFHEGDWACKGLEKEFKLKSKEFLNGFIPRYTYNVADNTELEITVYGAYKNWSPLPNPVNDLLEWGKPDLIVYDPLSERIILAIEETAAVPTGNQALQRCERIYGSSRVLIPFWYLISEFGLHVDGGVRTDSIWPTILSLKLSATKRTPSVVLHYSDADNPESYDAGEGMKELFLSLAHEIKIWIGIEDQKSIQPLLERQYDQMLSFIKRQWQNILEYLPGETELDDNLLPKKIAEFIVSEDEKSVIEFKEFLTWGKTNTLPKKIYANICPGGYIKKDKFVIELENIVGRKKAYNLSRNAGSKPQPVEAVKKWISQQSKLFIPNSTDALFKMKIEDFPASSSGLLHVTTAKNVLYLCDSWKDVHGALKTAYPRLNTIEKRFSENDAVLVYISNSMTPGRIFGDPFTGQLSAFSNIFARNLIGEKERVVITYYPHQVHSQMFDRDSNFKKNKGITILKELADMAIFHGGIAVDFKDAKII